jgi:hypothetical protein
MVGLAGSCGLGIRGCAAPQGPWWGLQGPSVGRRLDLVDLLGEVELFCDAVDVVTK